MRAKSTLLIALACFPAVGLSASAEPVKKVELGTCTLPWLPDDARCGVYEVFENRAAKSGRKIPLQVVVLPATGPQRQSDPLVYFAGGPGGSAIGEGVGYARSMPELRKDRDVLLIDARGTGPSAQLALLGCPELDESGGLQGFLEDFMPADRVRACRDRLQKTADLTQYSNDNVVDDTEEIRTALGYGKLNLMGTSYGARPIQVYLRRHPGSVRAAAMISPVPIDEIFPLVTARHSQRALDLLIAKCAGDPACKKAFPKLREEVAAVLRRIAKEPVKVQTVDAGTGQPVELTLSKNGFGQVLRRMLYYNNWISLTPLYLHLAANGDWRPLAEMAPAAGGGQGSLGGHLLSIACSEDLAFVRESEIPAAVAGTFLGDLRVRKQLEACQIWPAPKLGPEFHAAVTSDVPTLIFSGEVDPVTPPSSGDRVARGLKRSRHIVVPDAGHGLDGMEGFDCVPRTVAAFFAAGSPESLDTSCVAGLRRPGFLLSLAPEVQLKPEELARVTGAWMGQNGLKIRTEIVGGYLRVAFPNGNMLLAATSPTSFRPRSGEAGFLIAFDLQGGRAVSMTLREGGGTLTLTRETAAPASQVELKPCEGIPDMPPEARCGTYEVWENRAAKSGRRIPLRVVILPAKSPDRQPDPVVYLNGGPGDSNVDAASWLAAELKEINQQRDILLVDFRGTGGSGGLFCPEMETSAGLQGYLDHYLAPDQVKACAERLAKTADLSQYTNATTVDDLDEVRAALGYEKVNLVGGSGGSRTGLIYLRRHPDSVRTATLSGLVPTDERGPFFMARHVQRALDGLLAECDRDEACRSAFPKVREELAIMLQRAAEEPAVVALTDGETGKPVEVRLTRNALITTLRAMLYSSTGASRIPFSVHQAILGNWQPMAEAAQAAGAGLSTMARGYYLSLTCSEDLPFIREEEIPAVVRGSFLGDYRIRAQQAACAAWPVPPVGREFQEPVTSDVPALLISGERDPVTPPSNAERAARTLKNSLHVVIPHAGHSLDGLETMACLTGLMARFVEAGTVKGLDGSCLAKTKRPAFALNEPTQ